MRINAVLVAASAVLGFTIGGPAAVSAQGVDRLYVLDCGWSHNADVARWTPGINVGQPIDMSENCYLIHHAQGYFLWDTGYPDAVAAMPDGLSQQNGATVVKRARTLAAQLQEIGVKPSDIRYVGISHTHPDHTGNIDLFPDSTVVIQRAEFDATQAAARPAFPATHPVMKLDGDKDIFGDGSVMVLSTPGHTVGHESLLVHLPKTGWIVLSGDAIHLEGNWEARRVPSMNVDKDKSVASMQKIADTMAQKKARLWINHDKPQSDTLLHAPKYYE